MIAYAPVHGLHCSRSKGQTILWPSTSALRKFHHREGSRTATHPVRVQIIFCAIAHVQEKGNRDSSSNNCAAHVSNSAFRANPRMSMHSKRGTPVHKIQITNNTDEKEQVEC